MRLVFTNESKKSVPKAHLQKVAKKFESYLKKNGHIADELKKEVVLVFLPEKKAKILNQQFRSKNYATDVLSFASADPDCLGELVMCPQVLERQAKEHKHSYRSELTYMFIHGVLHLLGYDHERGEKDAKKMFLLQDNFFESVR